MAFRNSNCVYSLINLEFDTRIGVATTESNTWDLDLKRQAAGRWDRDIRSWKIGDSYYFLGIHLRKLLPPMPWKAEHIRAWPASLGTCCKNSECWCILAAF